MKSLLSTLLIALTLGVHAQYFIPPMDNAEITLAKTAYVITVQGDSLTGRVRSATIVNGQLRSIKFRLENGEKYKYTASDIKLLAVKPSNFSNFTSALSIPNLQQLFEADINEIINREWVLFEQALLPRKKDKYALLQLLNPGYDSKMKVYENPNAGETMSLGANNGFNLIGGGPTSYLVVIGGDKSQLVNKSSYRRDATEELFGDCELFQESYADDKLRWSEFAEHVLVYDQLCE